MRKSDSIAAKKGRVKQNSQAGRNLKGIGEQNYDK
jgi:hypothetical protein